MATLNRILQYFLKVAQAESLAILQKAFLSVAQKKMPLSYSNLSQLKIFDVAPL